MDYCKDKIEYQNNAIIEIPRIMEIESKRGRKRKTVSKLIRTDFPEKEMKSEKELDLELKLKLNQDCVEEMKKLLMQNGFDSSFDTFLKISKTFKNIICSDEIPFQSTTREERLECLVNSIPWNSLQFDLYSIRLFFGLIMPNHTLKKEIKNIPISPLQIKNICKMLDFLEINDKDALECVYNFSLQKWNGITCREILPFLFIPLKDEKSLQSRKLLKHWLDIDPEFKVNRREFEKRLLFKKIPRDYCNYLIESSLIDAIQLVENVGNWIPIENVIKSLNSPLGLDKFFSFHKWSNIPSLLYLEREKSNNQKPSQWISNWLETQEKITVPPYEWLELKIKSTNVSDLRFSDHEMDQVSHVLFTLVHFLLKRDSEFTIPSWDLQLLWDDSLLWSRISCLKKIIEYWGLSKKIIHIFVACLGNKPKTKQDMMDEIFYHCQNIPHPSFLSLFANQSQQKLSKWKLEKIPSSTLHDFFFQLDSWNETSLFMARIQCLIPFYGSDHNWKKGLENMVDQIKNALQLLNSDLIESCTELIITICEEFQDSICNSLSLEQNIEDQEEEE